MYSLLRKAVLKGNEILAERLLGSMALGAFEKNQLLNLALNHHPRLAPLFLEYDDANAFVLCAEAHQVELAKTFIEKGMSLDALTEQRKTLLVDLASQQSPCLPIIELLVEKGADCRKEGKWGKSALHFGISSNNVKVAKLFI